MRNNKHTFIKFLSVGLINTLVGLSIMYASLLLLHFSYWTSTFIGNVIGACVSYLLNKRFTFQSNARLVGSSFRFAIVMLVSYILAYKFGLVLVERIVNDFHFYASFKEEIAVLFGSGFYTILNYFGQKYVVFSVRYQQETRSTK